MALACGAALALGACGQAPDTAMGPCTLKVVSLADGVIKELEPPFEARQTARNDMWIEFSGSHWSDVMITLVSQRRTIRERVEGRQLSQGVALALDVGHWDARFADRATTCVREFTVDVLPPGPG